MSSPVSRGIADSLPELRERIEQRVTEYGDERDWQKLRAYEIAGIAAEEAAVTMVTLVLDWRTQGLMKMP